MPASLVRFRTGHAAGILTSPGAARYLSTLSLACARLAWAQQDVAVVSLADGQVALLHPHVHPGRRVLLLGAGVRSPAEVAGLLRKRGFAPSMVTALSNLGDGSKEQAITRTAGEWPEQDLPDGAEAPSVVAVECLPGPRADRLPLTPGLPDEAYEHDGQLTKRHVRAITLASLAPSPGELLWDVGAGAGSIGIEWMRAHSSCRAVAVERDEVRAKRIGRNAVTLGVPGLNVLLGSAPEAFAGLTGPETATPDAIFVGGGVSVPGLIGACWDALRPGGRLVVNVATLESEQVILEALALVGGELTRIEVSHQSRVGSFTALRPAIPITHWVVIKEFPG